MKAAVVTAADAVVLVDLSRKRYNKKSVILLRLSVRVTAGHHLFPGIFRWQQTGQWLPYHMGTPARLVQAAAVAVLTSIQMGWAARALQHIHLAMQHILVENRIALAAAEAHGETNRTTIIMSTQREETAEATEAMADEDSMEAAIMTQTLHRVDYSVEVMDVATQYIQVPGRKVGIFMALAVVEAQEVIIYHRIPEKPTLHMAALATRA